MNIGIYSESTRGGTSLGGSEFVVAVLAEALGGEHRVEILHHRDTLSAKDFAEHFGVSVERMHLRRVEIEPPPTSRNPWQRHRQERGWYASLSRPYELFIHIAHWMPPFCYAPKGMVMVLFPFFNAAAAYRGGGTKDAAGVGRSPLWEIPRDAYLRWSWRQRLRSYTVKTSISEFTRLWTRRRWGVDTQVIYPPADEPSAPMSKENLILSVGRFASHGVTKKQLEMVTAFRQMAATGASRDWEYACTGGLGQTPEDQQYFKNLGCLAGPHRLRVLANLPRADLRAHYRRAKIFWHATGLGEDEATQPDLAEHYGIVTAEAMVAGCVPVVIRRGAQAEIVEHGVNGFLWTTLGELQEYTALLIENEALREAMSDAARQRGRAFSREAFLARFYELAAPLLGANGAVG